MKTSTTSMKMKKMRKTRKFDPTRFLARFATETHGERCVGRRTVGIGAAVPLSVSEGACCDRTFRRESAVGTHRGGLLVGQRVRR